MPSRSGVVALRTRPANALAVALVVGLLLVCPARAAGGACAQDQADEYRDGPGLQIVKWGMELPYGTSPDRVIIKVKNTGTIAVTGFTYEFVIFDQNRSDIISGAKTFSVKKTIKPGDTKDIEFRIEHLDRDQDNTTVRLIKISYADGTTWDRFEKKE